VSKTPRYREVAIDLRRRLADGEFAIGSTLPSITALQEEYEVLGLNTIRQALAVLQDERLVESIQGRGTFVTGLPDSAGDLDAVREDLGELKGLLKAAQSALSRMERHLS
jgi:DNA-binding GntR family transcriptional regulator